MIKVVLFDWSGTLCDDYSAVHQKINKVIPRILPKHFHPLIKHCALYFQLQLCACYRLNISPSIPNTLFPTQKSNCVLKQRGVVVGIISTQSPKSSRHSKKKLYSSINVIKGYALYKYIYKVRML